MQPRPHLAPRLRYTTRAVARDPGPDARVTRLAWRSPLPIVAALLASAALAQLLVGNDLGLAGGRMTVLLGAALFAILIVAHAGRPRAGGARQSYHLRVIALAAPAICAAVACLYLPMPWGGLGAAAVVVALLGALRLCGS